MWTEVRVVAETGSTNSDVAEAARSGAPEGLVIAAESQVAGRGRLGRTWQSLPGAALTFSVLLRPAPVPIRARGWVPLLAGVAVARALGQVTGLDARLKWPNDVLADGKLAGILAEQVSDAIVVGVGINVRGRSENLPVATATSLELHSMGDIDRAELLAAILAEIQRWYLPWRATGTGDADACGLRAEYLRLSATVGGDVRVILPGGRELSGTATGVDASGCLVVRSRAGEPVSVTAGEVIHVR